MVLSKKAGLGDTEAQKIIESRDNKLAKQIVYLVRKSDSIRPAIDWDTCLNIVLREFNSHIQDKML